jgi:serine/threonine-protein kinase
MSNLQGQTFAGYEILAKLGQGGMGAVFKARQPKLDRLAALKIMASELANDPDFVARFRREAAAAANLSHPNIVQVYTAGESEGTHYIAMEFVDGETVKQHIEGQGRLDPREAIAITVFVAEALQYGWNKARLVHRDIKPDNIFLSKSGEVKVGDLGLAKTVGGATTNLTQTGMMMGSPHYISPEQARGAGDIDFRTDIYSLGCTLYHMLTGRPPYEGPDPLSVITKHVNDPPPAIFKSWPGCPVPLALVLGKMLAKRPHDRPASYEDLIDQLRGVHEKLKPIVAAMPAAAGEPAKATPTPAPAPAPAQATSKPIVAKVATARPATAVKPKGGARALLYAAAGVAAVAVVGGAVWWFANPRIETKVLDLDNGVTMSLSVIPPGKFLLGSTKEERQWVASNSKTQSWPEFEGKEPRKVEIKQPFWIGQTEVTVAQWRQFANARRYVTEAEKKVSPVVQDPKKAMGPAGAFDWRNPKTDFTPSDNQAATWLSWNDAVAFCKWLDGRERDARRLPAGWVVRLPAEAEWEYACRAGTRTKFWWGDAEEEGKDRLNKASDDDGFAFIAPVDSFGPRGRNRFGLADMLGNAREWCLDEFDEEGAHGEMWVGNAGWHVQKGGCAFRGLQTDRCAFREKCRRNYRAACTGFRIAVGPEPIADYEAFIAPRSGPAARKGAAPTPADAAAQQPRQVLDLLALTDPVKDRIKVERGASHSKANAWERRGTTLAYVSDGGSGKLAPPVAINARTYEIEVEFERLSGPGRFHVDLPIDATRIIPMNLDNPNIKMINARVGDPWPANRGARSKVIVRLERGETGSQCRVTVRLDGEWVTDWRGNENNVAQTGEPHPDFPGQPVTSIYIHKDSYEVRVWQLRIFDGQATVLRGASTAPALQHSTAPAPWLPAFCAEVAALPAEEQVARVVAKLKELNPGYDGQETHKIEGGQVTELTFSPAKVADLSPVRALAHLRTLVVMGPETRPRCPLSDLSPLRGLSLRALNIALCSVSDLSPLAGMPLESLCCGGTEVTDLGPLRGMPLTRLDFWTTPVNDLSPLRGMPLKSLYCEPAAASIPRNREILRGIETLGKINGVPAAEFWQRLDAGELTKPGAPSAVPVTRHPSLVTPADDAFCAEVAALLAEQQVARVVAKLTELNPKFGGKLGRKIVGGQVEELYFVSAAVTDISPMRALAKLKSLTCAGYPDRISPLSDISALRGLQLENLDLTCSRVSDLSALEGMPLRQFYCDPAAAVLPANAKVLRSIKTLETINKLPAAEFWKKVDAGEAPKP